MEKREALEWVVKLWRRLQHHPQEDKYDALQALLAPEFRENCPACEFVYGTKEAADYAIPDRCGLCPLIKLWEQGKPEPKDRVGVWAPCELWSESPYKLWTESYPYDYEVHRALAKQIADFAEKELENG